MKRTIILLFLLNSLSSFSQTTVKFIKADTKEAISGIYSEIYKNENSFVNCNCSNKDGYYTPLILKIDSTANYQFCLNNSRYEPVWREIDVTKHDTLIVQIKKDDYYIKNCDSLFTKRSSIYSWGKIYPPANK